MPPAAPAPAPETGRDAPFVPQPPAVEVEDSPPRKPAAPPIDNGYQRGPSKPADRFPPADSAPPRGEKPEPIPPEPEPTAPPTPPSPRAEAGPPAAGQGGGPGFLSTLMKWAAVGFALYGVYALLGPVIQKKLRDHARRSPHVAA